MKKDNNILFPIDSYSGEVLDTLLKLTAQKNETYQKGLIHVETDIRYRLTLPTAQVGNIVQDNVPTPDISLSSAGEDGFNTFKITERFLEPKPFMIFKRWDAEQMSSYWRPFQPFKNLLFRELDPDVQADFVSLVIQEKNRWLGQAIWQSVVDGDAKSGIVAPDDAPKLGANGYKYFDGVMKRLLDSIKEDDTVDDVNKANLVGNTKLDTGEAVEKALFALYKALPDNMRSSATELSYVMAYDEWIKYDEYLSSKQFKNADNTVENVRRFKGSKVIPVSGVPPHTIVLGKFNTTISSNLWMGIDWLAPKDENVFIIGEIAPYSTEHFIQMRLKADVNIVKPCEIFFHTAYKNESSGE